VRARSFSERSTLRLPQAAGRDDPSRGQLRQRLHLTLEENAAAPERNAFCTVPPDTFSWRTISLIDLLLRKHSCRIRAIISTVSIPPPTRLRPRKAGSFAASMREGQIARRFTAGQVDGVQKRRARNELNSFCWQR